MKFKYRISCRCGNVEEGEKETRFVTSKMTCVKCGLEAIIQILPEKPKDAEVDLKPENRITPCPCGGDLTAGIDNSGWFIKCGSCKRATLGGKSYAETVECWNKGVAEELAVREKIENAEPGEMIKMTDEEMEIARQVESQAQDTGQYNYSVFDKDTDKIIAQQIFLEKVRNSKDGDGIATTTEAEVAEFKAKEAGTGFQHGDKIAFGKNKKTVTLYDKEKLVGFEEALKALKMGNKVKRVGWKEGKFLEIQLPSEHSKMNLPYIFEGRGMVAVCPWTVSNEDILAEDWMIFV